MPTTAAPPADRTLAQRMDALARATEVRTRRCGMKAEFRKGADPIPFLADPPGWLKTMKVERFLVALPGVGRVKAGAILRNTQVSTSKTVGGLSPRQRKDLVAVLGVVAENLRANRVSASHGQEGAAGGFLPVGPPDPASGALSA